MTQRLRLGALLISSKVVTEAQVTEALTRQKETGRRLGETLVALGYVTELQVAQTLSHQLSVPWANLHHVDFSRELLNLVSPDVAVSSRVVPIYVRRVRQQGDVLFVATDDPLNEAALLAVATHVAMPVKAMVASALDLRNAPRVYYGSSVEYAEEKSNWKNYFFHKIWNVQHIKFCTIAIQQPGTIKCPGLFYRHYFSLTHKFR